MGLPNGLISSLKMFLIALVVFRLPMTGCECRELGINVGIVVELLYMGLS